MAAEDLRKNGMMAHLMDALETGQDIGHYGRLVFAMVARHFLAEDELLEWLLKNPEFSEDKARALITQVQGKDYNPPRRDRIWSGKKNRIFRSVRTPTIPTPAMCIKTCASPTTSTITLPSTISRRRKVSLPFAFGSEPRSA